MNQNEWDDNKIEDLLGKVPKIQDQRSKEDVFKRLKEHGLFDEEPITNHPPKKPLKKFNWIPIVVSIAAVFLLAILVPSFMDQIKESSNSSEESTMDTTQSTEMQDMKISESATTDESEMGILNTENEDLRTAVYPEEVEGHTVFRLGLMSDAADSLPITVLIPNEIIKRDLGESTPSGVELYNQYAPLFDESAIGFSEFHPYVGTISEMEDRVIHTLPNHPPYEQGSAALTAYYASLIDTFGDDSYSEVSLLNENGSGFEFSGVGEISTPIQLNNESTQYNYFRYTHSDGTNYLAPNFRQSFSSIEEAIYAMKEETNDIYQSVILPNVDYKISVENQVVMISFTEKMDLMRYDQPQVMQMIEGILLTAASFHMPVQFENVVQTEWQGFDFTTTLPIPVGANEISYWTVFQE